MIIMLLLLLQLPADTDLDRLIQQAWKAKDAAALWRYSEQHPGAPETARVTAEALHVMVHAGQAEQALAKAESRPPDDPVWQYATGALLEAAENRNEPDRLIRLLLRVLERPASSSARDRVRFTLAKAYRQQGRLEEARDAFETVARETSDADLASQARGSAYEITTLGPGQPAPAFTAQATDGRPIALVNLRGRVVLLHFWASW